MQKDGRNFSDVLVFRLIKEPVGLWLQTVIQRLEEHRTRLVNECISRMPY